MKAVKRLNQTIECNGCHTYVNPYVIEEKSTYIEVECPTCEQKMQISDTEDGDWRDRVS